MVYLTKAQRKALYRKWTLSNNHQTYRKFRASVIRLDGSGCVLVHWCGMWLGIETDGYTHS